MQENNRTIRPICIHLLNNTSFQKLINYEKLKGVENLELDKITKNYLPERVMKKLSDKQMQEFEQNVNNFSNGQLQTQQMMCKGDADKCPYRHDCPFYKSKEYPKGDRCPLELYYAQKWLDEYIKTFSINEEDKHHISLLVSLVVIEVQLMRQQQQVQAEGFEQNVVYKGKEETITIDKKLHNALLLIEQLENRKFKLYKMLQEISEQNKSYQMVGDISSILSKINKGGK